MNRARGTRYNAKRVRRVMEINGWALARPSRRRTGRAHTGRVRRDGSNERGRRPCRAGLPARCSDSVMIGCWNGDVVELGFVLDCCDRECIAALGQPHDLGGADVRELMRHAVAARFGGDRPPAPVQWLSDNESMDTPCTRRSRR